MSATSRAALVLLAVAGAAHCSQPHDSASSDVAAAAAPMPALRTPPTTPVGIAMHNLDAEIADREKRARAGEPDAAPELVQRYLVRAKYGGRVADLAAADATSARLVTERGGDARAHVARAAALSAIHEFAQALTELDRAAALGAERDELARQRAYVLLAVGREDEAAALMPVPLEAAPALDLAGRASIEARLGRPDESERLFEQARIRYRDVSPFAVAWMDFERARALEESGDRVRARAYLDEVARVLPSYAHAVVHLAALEPLAQALPRLQALERTSDDPEVLSATADALRRSGRTAEADAEASAARARFEEVLARMPLAFADHAASFYLGMGRDPARALELAKQNAENRPTAEAVELWLSAAQAARSAGETCAAAARAGALVRASTELRQRAAVAARGCP